MTKEVLVSINGLQFEVSEEEAVEVISVGEYYYRNGKHYIIYEDMLLDEKDGNSLVKNTIKISDNQVDIIKKGAGNVHMLFEKNKKNVAFYATPLGELQLGIYTTKIEVTESEEELILNLEYTLDINSGYFSDCAIKVHVRPRGNHRIS